MNEKILPRLTVGQAILFMMVANLLSMGYLISLTNYNHDVGVATQKEIIDLVNTQGNLSNSQRAKIITAFENLPDSGIASSASQQENHHLLLEILGNVTHVNK